MIPARYRWEWKQADERLAGEWARRLGIPPLAARVLVSRGWTEEEAAAFFRPADGTDLADPLLMKGMPEAAERIRRAIADGERIRVYGDYDADGVTSTALMTRLLSELGALFDTYIPHRSLEGYGLNRNAAFLAKEAGVSLIVTVDNGISAAEPIAYARELGMDVVVTDHHEPPAVLPEAYSLVNPKQPGCPYPFKGLCGAGVAFRLAEVLLRRLPVHLADLAAIGTVADLMPLVGENRTIVRLGLARLRTTPTPGIRALAAACGTTPAELSSGRIGFGLAPRLNAGGRLERADGAVRLLTTEDPGEAERLAKDLDRLNALRQRLVDETLAEAEALWEERKRSFGGDGPSVIVLSRAGWNAGIAGLVASKLVERHYRPAIVLAEDAEKGTAKGSARSIDGFDLYRALADCSEWMEHFGGHQAAAGLTIRTEYIANLEEKLHRLALERLKPEDWQPKKQADLVCALEELTLEAAEALAMLEPFGNGHPVPRLLIQGASVRECRTMGKESQHVRLTVGQQERKLEAVGFGWGGLAERLPAGRRVDMLGELGVNEWNGSRKVQFTIQDIRSEELEWIDRRNSEDPWKEIARLAGNGPGRLSVVCATPQIAASAAGRLGADNAVSPLSEFAIDADADRSEAATSGVIPVFRSSAVPLRTLVLIGLPDREEDVRLLKDKAFGRACWEKVYVFAAGLNRDRPCQPPLDRNDFARVYALLKNQGTWIDGPDGFLHRAATLTGLPLQAVRLIQDVFEELRFIRAKGAERSIVPDPPRRKLEESERYMRMLRQAEAAAFPDWPIDRLKAWAQRPSGEGAAEKASSRTDCPLVIGEAKSV
ncbi:single-stranded-DNA-specific exonuclease RecJ [Cohnella caldifontis]|uniref:single-stranded-DNA-specific exonuclease RecJ n=1 Tax=Cohnella caldifontis TaxID=3027471 RepID=UPI0023ECBC94|nr:single-stranded-DNA-specific exonuclease RecJ [Cohnella sp. YIM B05605]